MNLPTEKLYSLGRHKMFKCWKWSCSSDPTLGYNQRVVDIEESSFPLIPWCCL